MKRSIVMAAAMITMAFAGEPIYHIPKKRVNTNPVKPKGKLPVKSRPLYKFIIHGIEIEAYSKKDAIKRYLHRKLKK